MVIPPAWQMLTQWHHSCRHPFGVSYLPCQGAFISLLALFADFSILFFFLFFPIPSTGIINQWQQESKDKVISLLLTHLPLLKPGNIEAKVEYMKLLPKILAHSIEHNQHIEESRQLLSYALIHPATSLEDRSALAMWLNHLEDRTSGGFGSQNRGRSDSVDYGQTHYYHQRQNSDDKLNGWQNSRDSGISVSASSWQDKNLACENGHLPLYSSSSVPTTINTIGTSTSTSKYPREALGTATYGRFSQHGPPHPTRKYCFAVVSRGARFIWAIENSFFSFSFPYLLFYFLPAFLYFFSLVLWDFKNLAAGEEGKTAKL